MAYCNLRIVMNKLSIWLIFMQIYDDTYIKLQGESLLYLYAN